MLISSKKIEKCKKYRSNKNKQKSADNRTFILALIKKICRRVKILLIPDKPFRIPLNNQVNIYPGKEKTKNIEWIFKILKVQ